VNHTEHSYFIEEFEDMRGIELQTLVASRLEDMADQVEFLYKQGNHADAELLRNEGLFMADACDAGLSFLFVNDLNLSE
jgi:hypothetical protein